MNFLHRTLVAGFATLFLMGCSGSGGLEGVEGTVTLKGTPVANGTIQFHPTGTEGSMGGGDHRGG